MSVQSSCAQCGSPLAAEAEVQGQCLRCLLLLGLDEPNPSTEGATLHRSEPSPSWLSPGRLLGDRYEIRTMLGRGGMGEVWHAFDVKLRVDVALKSLRPEFFANARRRDLLRGEVRSAREVLSPNVCRVFDLIVEEGHELVSMEYIDGTTLFELLENRGPLERTEALELAGQFLSGLEAIHRTGLVHRDFKPENVMITRTGRVVVMDLGIAKQSDEGAGTVAGTPAYMAPEQLRGAAVDARADIFSAGVVLAEMIAEEGVREQRTRASLWKRMHAEPPSVPDSPWRSVLARAVSRNPERRYASVGALMRALEEVTLRVAGAEEKRPYPGLSAFAETDAEHFYGREAEVEAMWRKLQRSHLQALVGASGAGKSSFLRAGLVPALPDGWRHVLCHPGSSPFVALAQALAPQFSGDTDAVRDLLRFEEADVAVSLVSRWRKRHGDVVLILDPFEELFTLNAREVQSRFAALLARLALEADARVLLSMRDDFLLNCHDHAGLDPIFSELTPLRAPTGAALRRALVHPALKCGYRFEDEALVEEMLADVIEERGVLPMLAFTAARLWEERDRETGLLTRDAYEAIGGVGGALARHAEATLERIGAEHQPIVRDLFRNLVTAEGTRAAREQEALVSVFDEPDQAKEVLQVLIDARLLTSFEVREEDEEAGHHHVEIVHESLLTTWPRLVRWQTQDADSAQLRDQLRQAASLWESRGRPEDLLWTGPSFNEFQVWRARYPGGLTAVEQAFAGAMTTATGRRKRRRRLALASVITSLAVGLAVTGSLWIQSESERRRAEASKLVVLAQLELEEDPSRALAYALKSLELSDEREARLLALQAVQRGPARILETEGGQAHRVDFSPNGEHLAIGGYNLFQLWARDEEAPRILGEYPTFKFSTVYPAFSRGSDVLVGHERGDVRLWSVPSADELMSAHIAEGPGEVGYIFDQTDVFVSAEGFHTIMQVGDEVVVRRWSFEGDPLTVGRMAAVQTVDMNASGTTIAYSRREKVYLRSLLDWGAPPRLIGEHTRPVADLAFHPNGEWLAANDSERIHFWSLASPSVESVRVLPSTGLWRLQFDPSGTRLVSFGYPDGKVTAHLWDLDAPIGTRPTVLRTLSGNFFNDAKFDPNGQWLATTHASNAALWPLSKRYPWVLDGHEEWITDIAFTPNGKKIVSVSQDSTVRVWPLEAGGKSEVILREGMGFAWIDVEPRGEQVLVGAPDKVLVVPLDRGEVRELPGFSAGSFTGPVAWSTEGDLVAAAPNIGPPSDQIIKIWDLDSGRMRVLGPPASVGASDGSSGPNIELFTGLSFTTDGNLISFGAAGMLRWSLKDGTSEVLKPPYGSQIAVAEMVLSADEQFCIFAYGVDQTSLTRVERIHLDTGQTTPLWNGGYVLAIDPSDTVLVTGDLDGVVRVGSVAGGEPHLLFGHDGLIRGVAVSPDGRWIASAGNDKTIRLWPMPTGPPFHTLPYDELLERLRALTNLRAVESEASPTGYELELAPFPGWKDVPTF